VARRRALGIRPAHTTTREEFAMIHRFSTGGLAAAALAAIAFGPALSSAEEITLKAVAAFPRTELMTADFIDYVNAVNKQGKGVVQIRFLGGPEVANPREQPVGLRKGLFDIVYGPSAYYLGMFPEGDLFFGKKTPMERRADGHTALMDKAYRQKLGAHMLGHFIGSIGVNLFLTREAPMGPDGLPNLSGFKIRSSPAYRDFIKALGGTPVVMRGMGEVYTALQRGVVDGTGSPIAQVRDNKIEKFVKVGFIPDFLRTVMIAIVDAKKFDAMPKKAQDILEQTAIRFEKDTYASSQAYTDKERAALEKEGMKFVELKGAAREKWLDTFLETPWTRARKNKDKISLDIEQMHKLAN
jgi:TRAP-type transport system periplasmic protein